MPDLLRLPDKSPHRDEAAPPSQHSKDISFDLLNLEKPDADPRMEAIAKGRQKKQHIESQRPKTEEARIQTNVDILHKYEERYTTKAKFVGFTEENHAKWEIKTLVKGYENQDAPYRNEIIPETGTFIGCTNYNEEDHSITVDGTKALHFSEILYGQIEATRKQIRNQASQLSDLKDRHVPEFDLKKYIGSDLLNKSTRDMIDLFLRGKSIQQYKEGDDDGFDAFVDAPTTESKFRLAHYYNKDCTLITIVKTENDMYPSTEHDFSDRNVQPK